jgi:hypothetical protein
MTVLAKASSNITDRTDRSSRFGKSSAVMQADITVSVEHSAAILRAKVENVDRMCLRNVGISLLDHRLSQSRRPQPQKSLP